VASAQRSNGYFFVAPGGSSGRSTDATLHIGGGGEIVLGKGIGLGAEIGALGPTKEFSDVFGVFSLNGYYHFSRSGQGRKLDPFVTGGYTLFFRTGRANLANVGGGVNYWFHDRIGLRLEFRDQIRTPGGGTLHFWNVRAGIAFR
jgi:hypothetical protein